MKKECLLKTLNIMKQISNKLIQEAEMARTAAEETAKRQREEQERRDRELASRLQMEQDEDASQVGLSTAPARQKNM